LLSGNDFSGYFGRSFLAGSERLKHNHRMTDAAHNQHRHHLSATLQDLVGGLQAFREVVLNLAV
jgi:hypothetical protein